jgi:hypothetical protein
MAMFLFDVQQRNRLNQDGLLKRFSIDCYGKQKTLEDIRTEKAEKFKELNVKKGTPEYDEWFLKYNPNDERKRTNVKSEEKAKKEIILSPDAIREKKKNKLVNENPVNENPVNEKSVNKKKKPVNKKTANKKSANKKRYNKKFSKKRKTFQNFLF